MFTFFIPQAPIRMRSLFALLTGNWRAAFGALSMRKPVLTRKSAQPEARKLGLNNLPSLKLCIPTGLSHS